MFVLKFDACIFVVVDVMSDLFRVERTFKNISTNFGDFSRWKHRVRTIKINFVMYDENF